MLKLIKARKNKIVLPEIILLILRAPLSAPPPPPRRELESLGGGGGTRELVGAVGAVELAVAHEVRLDALGHALQTSSNDRQGARYLKYD